MAIDLDKLLGERQSRFLKEEEKPILPGARLVPTLRPALEPTIKPVTPTIIPTPVPRISTLEEQRLQRDIRTTGRTEAEIIASGRDILARQQIAPTRDILADIGRPTAVAPITTPAELLPRTGVQAGLQRGFAKAFLPETAFAQPPTGLISRAIEEKIQQQPEGVRGAEFVGRLAGTALQYMSVSKAIAPLIKKIGLTGVKAFAAKQGVDLLVDNIVQLPGEVIDSIKNDATITEDAKRIALRNVIDIGFNALVGIPEMVKLYKSAKATGLVDEALETAIDSLPPEQQRKLVGELLPEEQALKLGAEEIVPPRVEPALTPAIEPGIAPSRLAEIEPGLTPRITTEVPTRPIAEETIAESFGTPTRDIPLGGNVETIIKQTPEGVPVAVGELKERGYSRNIRTDEAMETQVRESFETINENYNALNNKDTIQSAQNRFSVGYEQALQDLELTKNQLRADNVPLSRLIANEAAKRGDMFTARRVISDIADTLTTAGQYSQAAKLLRESNDPATVLNYMLKELNKLNQQGIKRYGELRKGILGGEKGWNPIELTDDELSIINSITKDSSDTEKQQIFEEVFEIIQAKIPTSKREKFDAWRRISMLFNPKTHVRNTVGNTIMATVKKFADTLAVGGERFIPQAQRTKAIFTDKALKETANNYWNANKQQLTEGSRWEIFGVKSPFTDKRIFDTEWLESLNNLSKKTLEAEDVVFMKHHFTNDLSNFMKARGMKEPTQEAVDYALRRAQEATFRESNALAEMITKGKQSKYGLILEAAIPFSKTPANILKTGIDYSPAGVGKAIYQLIDKAPPEVFIESMSKGLTGTSLAALGYFMSKNGLARGEYKKKAKEEVVEQLGGQLPNSIKMPNGSYTVDWAQPASMPFFMGVAFQESMEKTNPDLTTAGFDALIAGGDSLVNASMLRGVKDLFGGQYGSTTEKFLELPFSYAGQAIPTVAGQIARTVDPIKRQRDYSGLIPRIKTQTQAKVPVLTQQLPPKRGLLGEELVYGKGALNALQQFLSPGYVATVSTEPVAQEIVRLYESVGSDFIPRARVKKITHDKKGYSLTSQEISEFQQIMGEYTKVRVQALLDAEGYKMLSDEKKADLIKDVNDDGYDEAKESYLKKKGVL